MKFAPITIPTEIIKEIDEQHIPDYVKNQLEEKKKNLLGSYLLGFASGLSLLFAILTNPFVPVEQTGIFVTILIWIFFAAGILLFSTARKLLHKSNKAFWKIIDPYGIEFIQKHPGTSIFSQTDRVTQPRKTRKQL